MVCSPADVPTAVVVGPERHRRHRGIHEDRGAGKNEQRY